MLLVILLLMVPTLQYQKWCFLCSVAFRKARISGAITNH